MRPEDLMAGQPVWVHQHGRRRWPGVIVVRVKPASGGVDGAYVRRLRGGEAFVRAEALVKRGWKAGERRPIEQGSRPTGEEGGQHGAAGNGGI